MSMEKEKKLIITFLIYTLLMTICWSEKALASILWLYFRLSGINNEQAMTKYIQVTYMAGFVSCSIMVLVALIELVSFLRHSDKFPNQLIRSMIIWIIIFCLSVLFPYGFLETLSRCDIYILNFYCIVVILLCSLLSIIALSRWHTHLTTCTTNLFSQVIVSPKGVYQFWKIVCVESIFYAGLHVYRQIAQKNILMICDIIFALLLLFIVYTLLQMSIFLFRIYRQG